VSGDEKHHTRSSSEALAEEDSNSLVRYEKTADRETLELSPPPGKKREDL